MDYLTLRRDVQAYLVASVIATEVPPTPTKHPSATEEFTAPMIDVAIAAVCGVIQTRYTAPGFPNTPVEVVLAIKQFSAVLRGLTLGAVGHRDIWPEAVSGKWFPAHVERCLRIWQATPPTTPTVIGGATHYYSPVGMLPALSTPSWSAAMREIEVPGLSKQYFRFFR